MTGDEFEQEWGMNRRDVMKSAAVLGAVGAFGLPAASGSVAASSHTTETLYLTDSVDQTTGTVLFRVNLNETNGRAELEELDTWPAASFNQVDALAATPDGTTVYAIDKTSGHLGAYDVVNDTFSDGGALTGTNVSGFPGGIVMAAYSPDGTLYMASSATDALYSVDTSAKTFTEEVTLQQSLSATDIAFTADGTLYMISTDENNDQALFTVDVADGSVAKQGPGTDEYFTGLGVRDVGTGDLVGSSTTEDTIYVIGRDGTLGTGYPLFLAGERYGYTFGDMTVGALDVCTTCDVDGLVAKFEFAYDEETDSYTFLLAEGSEESVGFESFTSKEGEADEPMTATFATEYCDLYALVKSGQEFEVQSFEDVDGPITVETANDVKYAISFVAFYCTESAAEDATEAFPSRGRGRGR